MVFFFISRLQTRKGFVNHAKRKFWIDLGLDLLNRDRLIRHEDNSFNSTAKSSWVETSSCLPKHIFLLFLIKKRNIKLKVTFSSYYFSFFYFRNFFEGNFFN